MSSTLAKALRSAYQPGSCHPRSRPPTVYGRLAHSPRNALRPRRKTSASWPDRAAQTGTPERKLDTFRNQGASRLAHLPRLPTLRPSLRRSSRTDARPSSRISCVSPNPRPYRISRTRSSHSQPDPPERPNAHHGRFSSTGRESTCWSPRKDVPCQPTPQTPSRHGNHPTRPFVGQKRCARGEPSPTPRGEASSSPSRNGARGRKARHPLLR